MHRIIERKYIIRLIISCILASIFIFLSNSKSSYAFSYDIKLKQNIIVNKGFNDPRDEFMYTLEAMNEDAPLPEGARGKYSFTLRGNQERNLHIDTSVSGRFKYKLYQEKNARVRFLKQDLEVYTLEINVIRTNEGLKVWWYVIEDVGNHKIENIEFTNIYNIPNEAVRDGSGSGISFRNRQNNIKVPSGDTKRDENQADTIESKKSNQVHKIGIEKLLRIPKTGDATNVLLYFVLCGVSSVFLVVLFKKKKDYLSS